MTTIVFDGYVLAADRRGTFIKTKHSCKHCGKDTSKSADDADKIIIPKIDVFFRGEKLLAMATAGPEYYHDAFKKVLEYVVDVEAAIDIVINLTTNRRGFNAIFILENNVGVLQTIPSNDNIDEKSTSNYSIDFKIGEIIPGNDDIWSAIGSGSKAARIARDEFKFKAKECIEFASKYDPATSKEITSFVFKEYPKEKTISEHARIVEKAVEKSITAKNNTVKIKRDKDDVVTNIKGKNEKIKIINEDGISTVEKSTKKKPITTKSKPITYKGKAI